MNNNWLVIPFQALNSFSMDIWVFRDYAIKYLVSAIWFLIGCHVRCSSLSIRRILLLSTDLCSILPVDVAERIWCLHVCHVGGSDRESGSFST